MAINIPIITSLEDKGIKAAKAAFANFKTSVADAEGGMNKFKAGSSSVFDAVKANAGAFAIAGAAAFATFAIKAVGSFQKLALEVDKFSISSGLKVEEASRWVEVAGDLGISVESVETAIGKMNRTVGQNPNLFKDLGVDLAYTNTGALDVNKTFLNTIQHLKDIKDPAERAKEGVKLLGKGWLDMALLIDQGAGNLEKSLNNVSDQKIIDGAEVTKARAFRDATNDLKDKFEDLAITLGEDLVPALTNIVNAIQPILKIGSGLVASLAGGETQTQLLARMGSNLTDIVKELGSLQVATDLGITPLELLGQVGVVAGDSLLYLTDQGRKYAEYTSSRIAAITKTTGAVTDQGDEVSITDLKWQHLKGTLNIDSAMLNAKDQLNQLKQTGIDAFNGVDGANAEYQQGLIDAKIMVLDLAESIALTDSEKNRIRVLVDTGEIEKALAMLEIIRSGGHTAALDAMRFRGGHAAGGPVQAGSTYLVGEKGPELFTPSSSGNISPNGSFGGNGGTINITVTSADPNAVVRALQSYNRNVGKIPVSVQ
jgi:hypothetical protein